jgi:hypothetical protein
VARRHGYLRCLTSRLAEHPAHDARARAPVVAPGSRLWLEAPARAVAARSAADRPWRARTGD